MKQEKEKHDKCKQESNKILLQGRNENKTRL
jgi:hypothetical protein